MLKFTVFFLLSLLITICSSAKLPSFLKKCKQTDPNLNKCILKNANDALPKILPGNKELYLPNMLPLVIPHADTTSAGNLKMSADNITISGCQSLRMTSVDFNINEKKSKMVMNGHDIEITADYDINGRILILPIRGKGPLKVHFDEVDLIFASEMDVITKDGLPYLKIIQTTLNWDANKTHYKLENLFNGDPLLGKEMNRFLNENTNEINREFAPILIHPLKKIIDNSIQKMMDKLPITELFDN